MPKKTDLPPFLKEPINVDWLIEQRREIERRGGDPSGFLHTLLLSKLVALLDHLGMPWPRDYAESLKRTIDLLTHFDVVPGFRLVETGAGRKLEWPYWRYWELELDVRLLRDRKKKLSALGACRYIAQHPEEYDNRYPTTVTTLHRQYLNATKLSQQPLNDNADSAELLTEEYDRDFEETAARILVKLGARDSSDERVRKVYETVLTRLGKYKAPESDK